MCPAPPEQNQPKRECSAHSEPQGRPIGNFSRTNAFSERADNPDDASSGTDESGSTYLEQAQCRPPNV